MPSPAKNIRLIRVDSVTVEEKDEEISHEPTEKKKKSRLNLESRLSRKENLKTTSKNVVKKTKEVKKVQPKLKGKKATLLPGQKTMNHFFK